MGTKRAFDEDLQEIIKHPKTLDHGDKPVSFEENKLPLETFQVVGIEGESGCKYRNTDNDPESENVVTVPDMVNKEFDTNASLPLVTESSTGEDGDGCGPMFCANLFSEFFDYSFPRRQLFHYDDIYSSLLNNPRKEIPVGPDHQADIPEFDPELARNYKKNSGGIERFLGVCIFFPKNSDILTEGNGDSDIHKDCECSDAGSIRCVRQHVKESRLKLRESLGVEKFVELGMLDMGQEVACRWTEEEERIFHDVVYLNPASLGRNFWNQLSIAFPSRTNKELVSYYFNVFILHRRAVQNRSRSLEIDSDDDEWRGSYGGTSGVGIDGQDFVLEGDQDSSSEDGVDSNHNDHDGDGGEGEGDFVIGSTEDSFTSLENQPLVPNSSKKVEEKSSVDMNENKITNNEGENGHLGSEYGFQTTDSKVWDPSYSSARTTNGLDLQSTCSMIEEIFGCSKNGNNSIQ